MHPARSITALAVAALLVSACGAAQSAVTGSSGGQARAVASTTPTAHLPVSVTDITGATVTITDTSRIVSLSGGVSELLVALGLLESIVGRDVTSLAPGMETVPLVSQGHDVSAESVLSLRPTLVVADQDSGPPEALAAVASTGVPVVTFASAWSFDEALDRARAVAAAVGFADRADELAASISRPTAVLTSALTIAFLYLRGSASVYMIGGDGSGADDVIEAIGGVDAGSAVGLTGYTPMTPESLVATDPDVILVMDGGLESVGGVDGLLAIPGVAQTAAGRERAIVSVPDADLLSFGPRSPGILGSIAEHINALGVEP